MRKQHFDVDVHHEDGYWVGVAKGVRGGATEARRLANLEPEMVDLLSGLLDLDPEQVEVRMNYAAQMPPALQKLMHEYTEARDALDWAQKRYEHAQSEFASELRAEGVSLRDAGTLLGLSFQRVQQLTAR